MNRIKKLFKPQAGDTYHAHQAGTPDGIYHRPSVDGTAGTGRSSTIEGKQAISEAQPGTSTYASEQPLSATGESSYGESARRIYSGTSQTSGPLDHARTRTTSTASKPYSTTKYIPPTNFASGGPSYRSKPSTTEPTTITTGFQTTSSTRESNAYPIHDTASPIYNTMTSNSSNQLPPGAFMDDTSNPSHSAGPSHGTTGAPQIGRQDLGESIDPYPAGSTSRSGMTGAGYGGTTTATGTGLTNTSPGDRSFSGVNPGNPSGRAGADYKGTDNFTPHPHDVDASNKPLAAPEDPDATRTSAPATQIAARVMGAGGGGITSYTSSGAQDTAPPMTTGATGNAEHEAYAHGGHHDTAPYSTERHVERDLHESEQTKGGPFGLGNDGASHGSTAVNEGGHHGTSGHGGQSIGGGAGHRAYDEAGTGTGTTSHDYGTGKSGTTDSSQVSPEESGRTSLDSEGRPKKRGLMDKILHRESPNKLHKEPPS